jgi:hypothetical protein
MMFDQFFRSIQPENLNETDQALSAGILTGNRPAVPQLSKAAPVALQSAYACGAPQQLWD